MRKNANNNKKQSYKKMDDIVYKQLGCKKCNSYVRVEESVEVVTCWRCVQAMVEPPPGFIPYDVVTRTFKYPINIKRPAGWKFMKEYVDTEGNVYFKGVEQPDLKGTMQPTVIKPRKKKVIEKMDDDIKQSLLEEVVTLKKDLKRETNERKRKLIENRITKINKELSK